MHDTIVDSWYAHQHLWQSPVNALEIPPRRAQRDLVPPVAVVVRVEWPRDGVEVIAARAAAWTSTAVLCHWTEPRLQILGAWFSADDVTRADHAQAPQNPSVRPAGLEPATRGLKVPCSAS